MNQIPGQLFTWRKVHFGEGDAPLRDRGWTNIGTAELSTLRGYHLSDVMTIKSHRTQGARRFTRIETVRERAEHEMGDVAFWLFESECGKIVLRIYND